MDLGFASGVLGPQLLRSLGAHRLPSAARALRAVPGALHETKKHALKVVLFAAAAVLFSAGRDQPAVSTLAHHVVGFIAGL